MPRALKVEFADLEAQPEGVLILFCEEGLKLGASARRVLGPAGDLASRAAAADNFKGKNGSVLDIVAPAGLGFPRLIIIGVGKARELKAQDFVKLGGSTMGRIPGAANRATLLADLPGRPIKAQRIAELALGAQLRAYSFERYKTKRKEDEQQPGEITLTIASSGAAAARKAFAACQAVGEGIAMARDLVNEPANVLYPEEFARRTGSLKKLGVVVEVLDPAQMKKLGMNALLGVGQGSQHESRAVIMRWDGGKRGVAPLAFVGKGVCFDTGGISIKPAASMEDMKGDMAGAACVVGLMHALAARKAKVNAVGAIGLVENMPGGAAQRPGDIVTTMSGQTIEIINTDAEGRLVLADVLHYVNTRFKPKLIIDLATLTGAIIVALAQEYAGLFANDDKLAERLMQAGRATGERVWRMPLGPEYDKMIDSKFADMKNTGGRHGGAITAAQLLARFVDKTPWAHLDIAGTGMGSPQTDINRSWGSGFGVRLLNELVTEHYEK
ncbi:MAG: leucyl aminopeptidase [Alphaproteobacteria bacterium]|nr:MAG: leucyl aminopeptidase [Alphaproteobacteria bacterium]